MRKAMTVILWLGLAACAVLVISLFGQKNALRGELQNETRKKEVLQTLYDQKKEEWTEQEAALTQERDDLLREKNSLVLERDALAEALNIARQETQTQRQTADALTAERETASGRLSEVLSMLLTPVTELSVSGAETEGVPAPREQKAPPLPEKGIQAVPFAE